jgi:hypothetical protein
MVGAPEQRETLQGGVNNEPSNIVEHLPMPSYTYTQNFAISESSSKQFTIE